MTQSNYGQLGPTDGLSEFNTTLFIINQALGRCRTVVPVQVKSCTNSGGVSAVGFVTIAPLVNLIDGLGNQIPGGHGIINNVPYIRIQGGANAIIMDPAAGDNGLALISDRDISSLKNNKSPSNPGSYRRFDIADGIYLGGFLNGTPTQYIQFTSTGINIVDVNGNKIQMGPGGITWNSGSTPFSFTTTGNFTINCAALIVNGVPMTIP